MASPSSVCIFFECCTPQRINTSLRLRDNHENSMKIILLAFLSFTLGAAPNPEPESWYVAMREPAPKRLTEGHSPVISPKGDIVAFLRGGQIFLMKPTGEDVKNAVTQKGTASELTWSPDGSTLAFVSNRRS